MTSLIWTRNAREWAARSNHTDNGEHANYRITKARIGYVARVDVFGTGLWFLTLGGAMRFCQACEPELYWRTG